MAYFSSKKELSLFKGKEMIVLDFLGDDAGARGMMIGFFLDETVHLVYFWVVYSRLWLLC
jgi:hypothetical protein